MSKTGTLAKRALDHGKYIFAYNHTRTNQVVYSLERTLNNDAAIAQLAYAGKNTVPTKLRKDTWKPFYLVHFPVKQQGIAAFRKLREWKKMHELCWDPQDMPPIERTAAEQRDLDKDRKELAEAGGNRVGGSRATKKRTDYQVQRRRIIMDQKANSVADLAAVLLEQDADGADTADARDIRDAGEKSRIVDELDAYMVEEQQGGLQTLMSELGAQEAEFNTLRATLAESKTAAEGSSKDERKQMKSRREELRLNLYDMRIREGKLKAAAQIKESSAETRMATAELVDRSWADPILEPFRTAMQMQQDLKRPSLRTPEKKRIGKSIRLLEQDARRPVFSCEGVFVRWADPTDLEYAEAWPSAVEHLDLGLTRNSAPSPTKEPVLTVEDWREQSRVRNMLRPEHATKARTLPSPPPAALAEGQQQVES